MIEYVRNVSHLQLTATTKDSPKMGQQTHWIGLRLKMREKCANEALNKVQ